jgi:uncharacterized membrane protein
MTRPPFTHPAFTIVLAVITGSMIAFDVHLWYIRLFATLAFLTFAPGAALIDLFLARNVDWATAIVISVGLSAALDVATAQAMVWSHLWNPGVAVTVLAALTVVTATIADLRRRRTSSASTGFAGDNGRGHQS